MDDGVLSPGVGWKLNMIPMFSIIIPVYNVERYLSECLESVFRQTIDKEKYEIVLVDDGSTDSSGSLCDSYKSDNVIVIHKQNEGLGYARNTGVSHARGKYIIFLDSDDYWAEECFLEDCERIISTESPDIIQFAKIIYNEPDDTFVKRNYFNVSTAKAIIDTSTLDCSSCNKVIKREFIEQHDLHFKKGISEDMIWVLKALAVSPKISYLESYNYVYRKGRSTSLTATKNKNYIFGYCQILKDAKEINQGTETKSPLFEYYSSYLYFTLFRYIRGLDWRGVDDPCKTLDGCACLLQKPFNFKCFVLKMMIKTIKAKRTLSFFNNVIKR